MPPCKNKEIMFMLVRVQTCTIWIGTMHVWWWGLIRFTISISCSVWIVDYFGIYESVQVHAQCKYIVSKLIWENDRLPHDNSCANPWCHIPKTYLRFLTRKIRAETFQQTDDRCIDASSFGPGYLSWFFVGSHDMVDPFPWWLKFSAWSEYRRNWWCCKSVPWTVCKGRLFRLVGFVIFGDKSPRHSGRLTFSKPASRSRAASKNCFKWINLPWITSLYPEYTNDIISTICVYIHIYVYICIVCMCI